MITRSRSRESVWSELPLPQIIFERKNGKIVGYNPTAKLLFGHTQERLHLLQGKSLAGPALKKIRLSRQRFTDLGLMTYTTGDGRELCCRVFRKIVTWKRRECFIDLLARESHGTEGMLKHLPPEKTEQSRLVQALEEKDILIKEIHHRIKNNLQMISSILYLKLISFDSGEVRNFLEGMRDKIKSISLIHERLLHTGKLDSIDIHDYLTKLLNDIQSSMFRKDLDLQFVRDIHSCTVNSEIALYCGLIVNELVTNTIKYAFADRTEGEVTVLFKCIEDGNAFHMQVSDNGCGLPEGVALDKSSSFGMQLLNIFVQQLNGDIKVMREQGTVFLITFPSSMQRV
jgi:two-component sensor histidine kinase